METMAEKRFRTWLERREPKAPEPFVPYLISAAEDIAPTAEALAAKGVEAVAKAIRRPGRDRTAAFSLLTGDALLTYACEALADGSGGLGQDLEVMIRAIGASLP